MTTITNNKLPEWRTALDKCVENYQSTRAWYEENRDSPAALDDMERAEDQLANFVRKCGFSIVLGLLDEMDELQELRRNYLALRGEIEDVWSQLYEAENQANEYASELQEHRKAAAEPVLYVMGMGCAFDAETASTCKGAVDSWVGEWNQERLPGQEEYKTVPLYTAPPAPDNKQTDELVMWVKRLSHSLRNARPDSELHGAAMDYLSRKGLISVEDVLR
ncbi:hypothetical protein [Salmonella enterica]|uniref:hypothetical protein n=1 Tax=Salmonella enterica TaxID=28901 RepID=UPI000A188075|nr:hypothetical protein [Salmonella enterica]OSJ37316.1 hypothetical protein K804_19415 [Salmonella enterica subsp. enterica serovar Newport str. SHSN014]